MISNITVEYLLRTDSHAVVKNGITADLKEKLRVLCTEYQVMDSDTRRNLRSKVRGNATVILLAFVTEQAAVAVGTKSRDNLDTALLAFDLSNILRIDFRDAFEHVAQLARAAKECDVPLSERATLVVPDIPAMFGEMVNNTPPAALTKDETGRPTFRNPLAQRRN